MKYVTLCQLESGMVLAKPICNKSGVILLNRNVKLTPYFCNKLKSSNIVDGVYIYDRFDLFENEAFATIINEKTRKNYVKNNVLLDLDAVSYFASSIVMDVQNMSRASMFLIELNNHSTETFEHSLRVAEMAVAIGIGLGYSNNELIDLATSALLHDIGKVKIDKEILEKNSTLTPAEREKIMYHPIYGYDMIKDMPQITATIKCGILMHHENIDGSGYPKHIKDKEIYKFAKIIHIVDIYDAMVYPRAYKEAYEINEVIEYMMTKVGSFFDEELFKVFMRYVQLYKVGDKVQLSNGKQAIVIENHPRYMLRPTIEFEDGTTIDLHNDLNALNVVITKKL